MSPHLYRDFFLMSNLNLYFLSLKPSIPPCHYMSLSKVLLQLSCSPSSSSFPLGSRGICPELLSVPPHPLQPRLPRPAMLRVSHHNSPEYFLSPVTTVTLGEDSCAIPGALPPVPAECCQGGAAPSPLQGSSGSQRGHGWKPCPARTKILLLGNWEP